MTHNDEGSEAARGRKTSCIIHNMAGPPPFTIPPETVPLYPEGPEENNTNVPTIV